ncbi:hypothetical protein IAT38_005424 [Cryptococcus sp. DSM 104549]
MAPLPPHSYTLSDKPIATRYTITTLDPLPSDIKRLILDHHILSCSQAELLPLLRTCSSLYDECAPLLYKEVVLVSGVQARSFFSGHERPTREGYEGPYTLDDLSIRRAELLKQYAHPVLKNYPPVSPKYILMGLVRKLVIDSPEAAGVADLAVMNGYVGRESMEKDKQHLFQVGMEDRGEDSLICDAPWFMENATPDHKMFSDLEWVVITEKAMENWHSVRDLLRIGVEAKNACFQLPYDPKGLYQEVAYRLSQDPWEHVVLHNVHIPYLARTSFNQIYADRVTIYAAQETSISDPGHSVHQWLVEAGEEEFDSVDNFIVDLVMDEECSIPAIVSRLTICGPPGKPLWNDEWMQQWVGPERWEDLKDAIVVKKKSESSCCEGCGNKVLPWIPKENSEAMME